MVSLCSSVPFLEVACPLQKAVSILHPCEEGREAMQKRHRFDSEPLCKTALGAAPPEIKTAALKIRVPTRQVNYRAHSPAPIPQLGRQ